MANDFPYKGFKLLHRVKEDDYVLCKDFDGKEIKSYIILARRPNDWDAKSIIKCDSILSKQGDILPVDFEYKQLYIRKWPNGIDENLDEAEKLFVALSSNFKVSEPAIGGSKSSCNYGTVISGSFDYDNDGIICALDECWYLFTREFPCLGFVETEAFLISMFKKYFHITLSYCHPHSLTVGLRGRVPFPPLNGTAEEKEEAVRRIKMENSADSKALEDFGNKILTYTSVDLSTVSTHVIDGFRQWVNPFAPELYNWEDYGVTWK